MNSEASTSQSTIIILAVIIILLCACFSFISGLGLGFGLNEATNSPGFGLDEVSDPDLSESPTEQGQLLFEDDFSAERWEVYQDNDHSKGYDDGRYFILVTEEGYDIWATAGRHFDDFILEVETSQLDGPDDNNYGVLLRYRDDSNFYRFEISSDGFYTFGKVVDDEFLDIISWIESDAIKQGNQDNVIRVEAVGSRFTFYINGKLVDTAIDSDFNRGDIGLLAGTYDEPGAHIVFDNLRVWGVE